MKTLALVMLSLICLSACNTFRGMGQDIERAGEAIQKAIK